MRNESLKEKHLKKSELYFMEKEGGGLKSVSFVLSVEILMGRGGDINWRRIPICICVLGVKKSFGHS